MRSGRALNGEPETAAVRMPRAGLVRGRLFWPAFTICAYTYAGYPVLLRLLSAVKPVGAPPPMPEHLPPVRLIVAAHDEEASIGGLLRSCAALDYPRGLLRLTVVLDACTDGTVFVVKEVRPALEAAGVAVTVIDSTERRGKGASLALAVAGCDEPVLVFTDANVVVDSGAVRALIRHLGDDGVGAVAGRRRPALEREPIPGYGDRIYWSYEAGIKRREARLASAAGVDGALYATRRDLFAPPAGCADDLEISLRVTRAGRRVAYAEDAFVWESATPSLRDEFRRKLRTQSCALETFWRLRGVLSPARPLTAWILVSHKLLRYVVPYGCLVLLLGLGPCGRRYARVAGLAAAPAVALAALLPGPGRTAVRRAAAIGAYGLVAQTAAALAPFALLGPRRRTWRPTRR